MTSRQAKFCKLIVEEELDPTTAYVKAGYSSHEKRSVVYTNAMNLFKTAVIQKEIARLKSIKARQIEQQKALQMAEIIINREGQIRKLEALRLKAELANDLPTALGCVREENSIYGLRVDVRADISSDVIGEISEDIKEHARRLTATPIVASLLLDREKSESEEPASAPSDPPESRVNSTPLLPAPVFLTP